MNLYSVIQKFYLNFSLSLFWRWGRYKLRILNISYGKNLIIQGRLNIIKGENSVISIGDNCTIKSGLNLNPLSRNIKTSIQVEDEAHLIIGNNCGFSSVCIWSHKSIRIGNNVNIGGDTIVIDSDAHSLIYTERRDAMSDMKNKISKPINIEDDVLIGTRCIILKGVSIGARSVIGSGSVVVNDIPSDCIAAGNPAKVIRFIERNDIYSI